MPNSLSLALSPGYWTDDRWQARETLNPQKMHLLKRATRIRAFPLPPRPSLLSPQLMRHVLEMHRAIMVVGSFAFDVASPVLCSDVATCYICKKQPASAAPTYNATKKERKTSLRRKKPQGGCRYSHRFKNSAEIDRSVASAVSVIKALFPKFKHKF